MTTSLPADDVPPGAVTGAGAFAVGNTGDDYFAVGRRCRHLRADLADGTVNDDGCLVCPWHGATYDVTTGTMVRGPQGISAKVPGLGVTLRALTRVLPLRRGTVRQDGNTLHID